MIGGVLADGFDGGKAEDFGVEDFGVEAVELHKCFGKKGREGHQIEALEERLGRCARRLKSGDVRCASTRRKLFPRWHGRVRY